MMGSVQPRLIDIKAAAEYCGVSVSTFRKNGLQPVRIGHRCMYDIRALDLWIDGMAGLTPRSVNEEEAKVLKALGL